MALFKMLHGDESNISLDMTPFHEGWGYITHNGYYYVDLNIGTTESPNNQRIKLNAGNAETLLGMTLEEIQKSISWNDLLDRPFGTTTDTIRTTAYEGSCLYSIDYEIGELRDQKVIVTVDGVEYEGVCTFSNGKYIIVSDGQTIASQNVTDDVTSISGADGSIRRNVKIEVLEDVEVVNILDEKYIPDSVKNVQPDWSVNDETSPAYIKNRPFYTTDPQEIELCNDTYDFIAYEELDLGLYTGDVYVDRTYFTDEVGQEVKVVYDGTEYNLTSKYIESMDMYYVGNGSLLNGVGLTEEDTGEVFVYPLGGYFFTLDTDAQHTVKICVDKVTDVTIPHKYLGINVWTGDDEGSIVTNSNDNIASGYSSFAMGYQTTASGNYSHAEGFETTASGDNSHTEGSNTTASNYNSHAEGSSTTASGNSSHAEGSRTVASAETSHAEGRATTASAWNAHSEGQGTEAAGRSQHVFGEYNVVDKSTSGISQRAKYIQIAGNGGSSNAKSNAYTLDWSGNAWFAGDVKVGGTGQDDEVAKTLATTDDLSWNSLKDRPFYYSDDTTLYEATVITSDLGGFFGYIGQGDEAKDVPALIEEKTYTVVFDGTPYSCVCSNGYNIGNLSILDLGEDTGEPFVLAFNAGYMIAVVTNDTVDTTHSVKVDGPMLKTIDEQYLPELPYVTLQEGNQYWVGKSDFAQTNSNLTYKGQSYSTNHDYFLYFLTAEGIWQISLTTYSSAQVPSMSSFRMNYASSGGTLSFYWSNESNTTEITTSMYAYLHDVNTGNIIRRANDVQSVTIGAYTKKSHNVDFYIDKSNPQPAEIVRSFDDYVDVESRINDISTWTMIYDSGEITSEVNSFANIDISGYKSLRVAIKCVQSTNTAGTTAGAVTFTGSNGTEYSFSSLFGNLITNTADRTSGAMARFSVVDGFIICEDASRGIIADGMLSTTEGEGTWSLATVGSGLVMCNSPLTTMSISTTNNSATHYYGVGSKVIVWGCKA